MDKLDFHGLTWRSKEDEDGFISDLISLGRATRRVVDGEFVHIPMDKISLPSPPIGEE